MLTDLILKVKEFSSSFDSRLYVKDLRRVMVYDGRKCQYPKNYDQIVEFAKIIKKKDRNGKSERDEEKNQEYQLEYNGYKFDLTFINKVDSKSYFTISFLINKGRCEIDDYHEFYELFGFKKKDLEEHIPIFEAQKAEDLKYPFKLKDSSILTNNGKNGELLYASYYKKLSTSFIEIRDQNGSIELDKSLISVPIILAAGSAKKIAKCLTSIPMELGEYLVNRQDLIAKFFGYLLFTPAMAVKNLVNIGATVLKAPILLFVADKKKYGDSYWIMWKHQLKWYWKETKNDYSVIKKGKRSEKEEKDYPERDAICGTWKELDTRRQEIEEELKEVLSKSSESVGKSTKLEENLEGSQNEINKRGGDENRRGRISHVDSIDEERKRKSRTCQM